MVEINKCNICGVVPTIDRSYSSRMISHKCKDYHSGWGNQQAVIKDWNENNPPKEGGNSNSTQQLKAKIAECSSEAVAYLHAGRPDLVESIVISKLQQLSAV